MLPNTKATKTSAVTKVRLMCPGHAAGLRERVDEHGPPRACFRRRNPVSHVLPPALKLPHVKWDSLFML